MKTHFAIFNPASGTYTNAATPDEAVALVAKTAIDFYLSHAHGNPVAVVTVDNQGAEKWAAPDGTEIVSPQELAKQLEAEARHRLSFANAGVIPLAKL